MDVLQAALRCVGVPLAIATAVVGLCFWLAHAWGRPSLRAAAAVLGLGLGYVGGHVATIGLPPWPLSLSAETMHWPLPMAAAAIIIGLVEALTPAPGWLRWMLRLPLVALAIGLVLQPMLDPQRDDHIRSLGLAIVALAVLASWVNVQAVAQRLVSALVIFALGLLGAFASVAFVLVGHSVVFAELTGSLAVPLLVVWLTAMWNRGPQAGQGLVTVYVPVLTTLLLNGVYYADLSPLSALLLAFAPAGLWLAHLRPLRPRPRLAAAVGLVAVLVALGAAIGIGVATAPKAVENETAVEEL
jgi:hypothetical protein